MSQTVCRVVYSETNSAHAPTQEFYAATGWEKHVEQPIRAVKILESLNSTFGERLSTVGPSEYPESKILRVHDAKYLEWLKEAWTKLAEFRKIRFGDTKAVEHGLIPDVFTYGPRSRLPSCHSLHAGHYCFDTYTPILPATYREAVVSGVNVVLTASDLLHHDLQSKSESSQPVDAVYALCRPPGHHAGADYYGGYCYLNNAAIAVAHFLDLGHTRVSVLDIDYHHGNGTQDIFFDNPNVQYISIHGDPNAEFPYFSGYATEVGSHNQALNLPLPLFSGEEEYHKALEVATSAVRGFGASVLVVSLGVDTQLGDPMGTFKLEAPMYERIGKAVAQLQLPTLVVQEGGYRVATMGDCVANFLKPFWNRG